MKKFEFIDDGEKDIIESFQRGEWKPAKNQKRLVAEARSAAKTFMRKEARMNIRLTHHQLQSLKLRAAREGLPYQTLASSILHRFLTGQLQNTPHR